MGAPGKRDTSGGDDEPRSTSTCTSSLPFQSPWSHRGRVSAGRGNTVGNGVPAGGEEWGERNPWEGLQNGHCGCCSVAKSCLTFKRDSCWNFSGGLVVKSPLPMQGVWVRSLVGELRPHMPQDVAQKRGELC